ncbi:MAG: signal peptidase II [Deltaproteobacteria bacterium]|nr:signal peptidase II [Deltaproteobacteria bacterium]
MIILDQLTKWFVNARMPIGERIPILSGYFDLVHFRNTGAAFGLFSGMDEAYRSLFFYGVAVIAVVILVAYFRSLDGERKLETIAISLIVGGVVGNIIDRVRFGEVIDFLSLHIRHRVIHGRLFGQSIWIPLEWPAFNVADSAITIAMILLLWTTFFGKKKT